MKRMIGRPPLAVAQLDTSRKLLASQRSLQSLTPKAVTKTHFQLVVVFFQLVVGVFPACGGHEGLGVTASPFQHSELRGPQLMIATDSANTAPHTPETSLVATLYDSASKCDNTLVDRILESVESNDFSDSTLEHVFAVTKSLVKSGASVDRAAIEAVARKPTIAKGMDLDEVFQCPPIVEASQLDATIEAVVRSAGLRRVRLSLQNATIDVQNAASDQTSNLDDIASELNRAAEQLTAASSRAKGTNTVPSLTNDLDGIVASLKESHGKEFLGLPTHTLPMFDKYTSGVRGFNVITAEPGAGKTALFTQVGVDIAERNTDAVFVFFSFEMSRHDILLRLISMMSELHWKRLVFGTPGTARKLFGDGLAFDIDDEAAFKKAIAALKAIGDRIAIFDIEDFPQIDHTEILRVVRNAKKQVGANKAFVLVDSMQAMPFVKPEGTSWGSDIERDNFVIRSLLALQRTLKDPLMLISEQNKEGMGKKSLKSTRGTARAVYSPDCVFVLKKQGQNESQQQVDIESGESADKSIVNLHIIKGRDGTRRGTIPLEFHHVTCTFTELSTVAKAYTIAELGDVAETCDPIDPSVSEHDK